ncbi:uncharacterized protein LOC119179762 [Rhipicephalus microplus]|uniref:uncharacterized protein LOC119179762 n=1 Tax=Rhipicephalus microplus TaxID=6941 RepID=UPI003F6C5877
MKIFATVFFLTAQIVLVGSDGCIARSHTMRGCRFMGHSLRNGESLALIQPCVRVICLLNGLGLRLRTCPFQTGQSVDVAGLGQASPVAYPHCCERCRAIR